ncbi:MAG: ABC transporter ATP-binding protein [Hyphomicrobiaceae bacterium]
MSTDAPVAIQIRDVEKVYGSGASAVKAIEHASLSIADNEFFTLLGPSGCGKTTLLRLIAGFEATTAGEIFLYGEEIETLPPFKRPVNTVFQHYSLFPHMTVAENVGFGLKMLGQPKADIQQAVQRALSLVKMGDFAARKPAQMSGGQQQRVALARALAPNPKVLLLDEPLSALDLKLRQAMRNELKTLQRETGITFVFVTHDQEEALTMSDRIAVMSNGLVQQIGSPLDIYERPLNRFVADFIGDTNFIEAEIESVSGGDAVCRASAGLALEAPVVDGHGPGDRITLALRPEKMSLASTSNGAANGQHSGQIESAEYLGTSTSYKVALGDRITLAVREQNPVDASRAFSTGDTVQVNIPAGTARMLVD